MGNTTPTPTPTANEVIARLLAIGFRTHSQSVFRHGPIEVKFTETGLSVYFWDKDTADMFNAFAEFGECEVFKEERD